MARGALVGLPSAYYNLNLILTEGEFRCLKGLPAGTTLEVRLCQINRNFRDGVIKSWGTFNDPRIFPQDYVSRMIPLVKAMINYFDDNVDVVGHYCGLEIEDKGRETNSDPHESERIDSKAHPRKKSN